MDSILLGAATLIYINIICSWILQENHVRHPLFLGVVGFWCRLWRQPRGRRGRGPTSSAPDSASSRSRATTGFSSCHEHRA